MTEPQSHVLFSQLLQCMIAFCALAAVVRRSFSFALPVLERWKHAEKDSLPLNVLLWELGTAADRLVLARLTVVYILSSGHDACERVPAPKFSPPRSPNKCDTGNVGVVVTGR